MDDANQELESSAQPVYDRLRRPADQLCLTRAVTQNYLQARHDVGIVIGEPLHIQHYYSHLTHLAHISSTLQRHSQEPFPFPGALHSLSQPPPFEFPTLPGECHCTTIALCLNCPTFKKGLLYPVPIFKAGVAQ
jgi:hypothetical protein